MRSLAISFVGLEGTDFSVLKVATNLLTTRDGLQIVLHENNFSDSNILIIDIDKEAGKQAYKNFEYGKNHTLLVICENSLNDQRHYVLRKPVRVQTLRDAIFDIYNELFNKLNKNVGSNVAKVATSEAPAAATLPAQTVLNNSVLKANDILFFNLLELVQQQQCAQLFCSPFPPLFINAPKKLVATSSSREVLRKITRNQSNKLNNTKLLDSDFEVLSRGQLMLPLEHLLWSSALYGSNGILMKELTEDTMLQLKAWPNFSRLEFEPEHMKLTSLLSSMPMSVKQVHARTQLALPVIIGFFNAIHATGLTVIRQANQADKKVENKPVSSIKQGLLNKIAQRLKISVT